MADVDGNVLNHYNLTSAYPTEWPKELDDSDDDETSVGGIRRSRSRYSALERSASDRRNVLPGSQKTGDGRANLVQKDEPDPLGGPHSVVQSLKQRGLPIEQDSRLRNKFMLSSTTFSPALFLSQTHPDSSTEDLLRGLDFLSKSIDQKSASLKVLVESNFERFVRAKATIDNVYTEMRNQGMEPEVHFSPRHSRQVSRASGHFRNFSSGSASGMTAPPAAPTLSKNALRKETDYGVQGLKMPLLEVSQKAEDIWGPALGGKERETSLKAIMEAVEKERPLYELGGNLNRAIKQKDYQKVVELYNLARKYVKHSKMIGEMASQGGPALTDEQVHNVLVTGRMWLDVEEQIKTVKREIWRRLSTNQTVLPLPGASQAEEHMELVGVLLELGVDDNPIWVWLLSRYDNLKNKISAVVDRSKVEIEIMRRRLDSSDLSTTGATYLRQAGKQNTDSLDSGGVIEFWEAILTYLTKLLSHSSGLLGEIVDFWDSAKSFIDGHKQHSLPPGFEDESRKHHRLSDAGVRDLSNGAVELVNMIREAVSSLLHDPPTEDLSSLVSPSSANTPKTPASVVFSPTNGQFGKIDSSSVPEPSPKKGEAWEDFAFWPPQSNCLSAVHYLAKVSVLIATAAGEMTAIAPVTNSTSTFEKIKSLLSTTRERCIRAICEAWNKDAENCKNLEDWSRAPDHREQTRMPMYFNAYEKAVLSGLQEVMYCTEAVTRPEARNLVTAPPTKLLQMVRSHFVESIHKTLNGMLENAEKQISSNDDDWVLVTSVATTAGLEPTSDQNSALSQTVDVSNRNVRMLLTLSNLKVLRVDYVPQLISAFESSFSVKLTEEGKAIRDTLGQIDHRLFQSYIRPTALLLTQTIKQGINSPSWVPSTSKPEQVRPYVYAAMMTLVMVHTEVSTTVPDSDTSASGLLSQTLSHLLEHVSQALLDGFKERKGTYNLPALMQATLDTEFIAQTMSQYATKKATDLQSQIYVELDKRTNNESRARLQQELIDLRVVLKKLRESSRGSFGCFRRQRSEKDRGRSERKATG